MPRVRMTRSSAGLVAGEELDVSDEWVERLVPDIAVVIGESAPVDPPAPPAGDDTTTAEPEAAVLTVRVTKAAARDLGIEQGDEVPVTAVREALAGHTGSSRAVDALRRKLDALA